MKSTLAVAETTTHHRREIIFGWKLKTVTCVHFYTQCMPHFWWDQVTSSNKLETKENGASIISVPLLLHIKISVEICSRKSADKAMILMIFWSIVTPHKDFNYKSLHSNVKYEFNNAKMNEHFIAWGFILVDPQKSTKIIVSEHAEATCLHDFHLIHILQKWWYYKGFRHLKHEMRFACTYS